MTCKEFYTLYNKVLKAQKSCEVALNYVNNRVDSDEYGDLPDPFSYLSCALASFDSFFDNIEDIEIVD